MKEPKLLDLASLEIPSTPRQQVFLFLLHEEEAIFDSRSTGEFEIIARIREGLPKIALNNLLEKTSISKSQVTDILHISLRQLNRYTDTDLLPTEQSIFLFELSRMYVRTIDILGDERTADEWLHRSNTALNGKSPIELLDTIEGYRIVDDLLSQIEFGFFS